MIVMQEAMYVRAGNWQGLCRFPNHDEALVIRTLAVNVKLS